jgi:hypothetical protein
MAKIILTEEEEIQYMREVDRIQEMIPDIEVQVIEEPVAGQGRQIPDSKLGEEFRNFLRANNLKTSLAGLSH